MRCVIQCVLVDSRKLFLCLRRGILIRMVLLGQFVIGLLDLLGIRVLRNPEQL